MNREFASVMMLAFLSSACFVENFEEGQGKWSVDNGVWEVGTPTSGPNECHEGNRCAATVLDGNYPFTNSRLVSPSIWLVPANPLNPFPSIKFWHWFAWSGATGGAPDQGRVQISVYDPLSFTWSDWMDLGDNYSSASNAWTMSQVDLAPHTGQLVRLAFHHKGMNAFGTGPGWYVDEVEIPGIAIGIFD